MSFLKLKKDFLKKYRLSFQGNSKELPTFLTIAVHDNLVYFDMLNKSWTIDEYNIEVFIDRYNKYILNIDKNLHNNVLDDIGSTMKLKPYLYQKESIKFVLDNNNALLVLPCGAGKTPSGIGMYIEAVKRGIISGKGMIVVKASLKAQWVSEVGKFSDLKAVAVESPSSLSVYTKSKINKNNKKILALDKIKDVDKIREIKAENEELEKQILNKFKEQFKDKDLFVVNYEALLDDTIRKEMHNLDIEFIFADEVHMIGSKDSKRSKALHEFEGIIKVGATATPITKNPENVFSIFKFIAPELFPTWSRFSNDFVKWAGRGRIAGVKNGHKLTSMIAPYTMIKSKEEISDQLPSLRIIQRYVTLSPEQYDMHNKIMEELDVLKENDFAIRSKCKTDAEAKFNPDLMKLEAQILALQTFAQEIADEPKLLEMSDSEYSKKYMVKNKKNLKMELFMDLLDEIISSGEKVAVFSKFERMQSVFTDYIYKYDKSIKVAYVNGTLSSEQRFEEVYTKFRDNDDYKVLLLSNSGAEGLNLSKCKYLIEYDIADSYAIQTQRHGRLERADSIHDNVTVYQIIAKDSWDEIQLKIVEKKEKYDIELIKSIS